MLLTKITLKPGENKVKTLDYSDWLQTDETVQSVSVSIDNITVPPLVATAVVQSDYQVSIAFSGGLEGEDYTVGVTAVTSLPLPTGAFSQTRTDCIGVEISEGCDQ